MNRKLVLVWVLLLAALGDCPAVAKIWRVEKDFSGDYHTIHLAMTAAVPGDTIMIGPGRFDDFHPLTAPAWTREVIVGVTKDNLTFIGSGPESTIIGPTEMYLPGGLEPMAIAAVDDVDAKFVDIDIENAYNGLYWSFGRVEIEGCRFRGYKNGLYLNNDGGASVTGCSFYSEESLPIGIAAWWPVPDITVSDCLFEGPDVNEVGIYLSGIQDVHIVDCHFTARVAIIFSGAAGRILDCTTTDTVEQSLWATSGAVVDLVGNQFHGDYASLEVDSWSQVTGTRNIFTGGTRLATIHIGSQSLVTLNDNHIFKSGQYAAKIDRYFYEIVTNDLTNNYWGTDDPDLIAEWIWDYNDDPVTRAYIDFLPIADGPVSQESTSWGTLKSMFR